MRLKTLLLCLIISQPLFALDYSHCNGTKTNPCLVQDTINDTAQVKNWRSTHSLTASLHEKHGNTTGLDKLNMSGSAAPSAAGFKTITDDIKKISHNSHIKIINVDLRQESHGYLNKNAITLASENDWANLGKSRREVFNNEKKWLKQLDKQKTIKNVLTPAQFKANEFNYGKNVIVQQVRNEKEISEANKLQYFRLTVTDHMAPTDADVDRFVALTLKVKSDTWLHFHCRGGDGRTTTFMVMYDMLHNADKVSLEDIVKRQAAVAPYYDVLNTASADPVKVPLYQKRALFLRKFYVFAQAYLNGYIDTWSAWSEKHKDL